jgi:hypothetical protein
MVMVILIAVHKYKLGPCISNKHFASAEYWAMAIWMRYRLGLYSLASTEIQNLHLSSTDLPSHSHITQST